MSKSTHTYWNPLQASNRSEWTSVKGLEGIAEELTLSIDEVTGEYTRPTRFFPGADTSAFGGKSHDYPEEVFVVTGRLYDAAFDIWLEPGQQAGLQAKCMDRSRPRRDVPCWRSRLPVEHRHK